MSKKPNIHYIGKIPCEIKGHKNEKVSPGQSLWLPGHIVDNLVLDKNWERLESIEETPPGTKKGKKEHKEKKEKGGK